MKMTKRAVLYIGYKCNLNCSFCYYHFMGNKKWKSIFIAKIEALVYRLIFSNRMVDLTGGEPTIYPHIISLVRFCKRIGLRPSIITNGIALANEQKVIKLKEAGIFDFLVSVHGLNDVYDELVGLSGAFEMQKKGLQNLTTNKIPVRVNITINKFNVPQLLDIVDYSIDNKAKVLNFICFNPFYEWEKLSKIDFQEKHEVLEPYLKKAIDVLNDSNVEANLRYFPFCFLKGYEKYQYNFYQVPYDSHEWDFMSWHRNYKLVIPYLINKFVLFKSKEKLSHYYYEDVNIDAKKLYFKSDKCKTCSLTSICDGVKIQYYNRFGDEELNPYSGEIIEDTTYYIKEQFKICD